VKRNNLSTIVQMSKAIDEANDKTISLMRDSDPRVQIKAAAEIRELAGVTEQSRKEMEEDAPLPPGRQKAMTANLELLGKVIGRSVKAALEGEKTPALESGEDAEVVG
jgi:hypothetical protein